VCWRRKNAKVKMEAASVFDDGAFNEITPLGASVLWSTGVLVGLDVHVPRIVGEETHPLANVYRTVLILRKIEYHGVGSPGNGARVLGAEFVERMDEGVLVELTVCDHTELWFRHVEDFAEHVGRRMGIVNNFLRLRDCLVPVGIPGFDGAAFFGPYIRIQCHLVDQDSCPVQISPGHEGGRRRVAGEDHVHEIERQIEAYGAVPVVRCRKVLDSYQLIIRLVCRAKLPVFKFMGFDVVPVIHYLPIRPRDPRGEEAEAFAMPLAHLLHQLAKVCRSFFGMLLFGAIGIGRGNDWAAGAVNVQGGLAIARGSKTVEINQVAHVVPVQVRQENPGHARPGHAEGDVLGAHPRPAIEYETLPVSAFYKNAVAGLAHPRDVVRSHEGDTYFARGELLAG